MLKNGHSIVHCALSCQPIFVAISALTKDSSNGLLLVNQANEIHNTTRGKACIAWSEIRFITRSRSDSICRPR